MPRRPTFATFNAFSLDPRGPDPLHRQLYDELRRAILSGRIAHGSRLPASRELAQLAKVSRNTVLSAYDQLLAEGFIESRAGSGTYVADAILESHPLVGAADAQPLQPGEEAPSRRMRRLSKRGRLLAGTTLAPGGPRPIGHVLRPGLPALDHFPIDVWRRLYDRRLRRASVRLLSYEDPQGYLPLREAIAAHLAAARGARCGPENILVVSGSQQATDLAARLLLDPGDTVWMEDPGYFAARSAFAAAGCEVVPVPVDGEGMDVGAGIARAPTARLAYCTPSHQNPLGVTLSLPRRMALLHWAERTGAWVLEDDNASEYRYHGRPLAALQGIDSEARVIYAGTFSKVMFSALRLGYAVLPADLVHAFVAARQLQDRQSPGVPQAVLADFMNEGHFSRHLRRMRTLYATRLEALLSAVRTHASDVLEVEAGEGGITRVLMLPAGVDDARLVRQLSLHGILALPLSAYCIERGPRGGLVCGFGAVDEMEIESSVRTIAEAVRTAQRTGGETN